MLSYIRMKNYYKIIGVNTDADSRTIKNTYLLKIKKYHPDVYTGDKSFAEEKTRELNEAYDILSDDAKRALYDKKIKVEKPVKNNISKPPKNSFFKSLKEKIIRSFKYFVNKVKEYKKAKKQKKNKKNLTDEQLHLKEGKKKLNALILLMIFAIFAILFILLI
ncbi:MAG: hypothetical protein E7376_03845 [Clostridiales bacterium]|nr:hypothetical protein [Clostridiales bacterium]